MSTLARLVVKLVTDVTEFTSGLESASTKLNMVGQKMASAGDKMTLGVTLPLVAAGVAAVKFASDLNETRNKTEVVFGDMSQAVFDFADNSASALGMSERAALEATSTFGNLFTSMGIGKSAAADMSTGLVALAADLASFNNLNPEEVFLKLRSGIVGEVEPLRALGINVSAVAVEAKAMQMGLADANGELSEQAKIMARYAIIMEQSSNAQGDFARTSDGLANSTRIARAEFENMMASFGGELQPIAIQFMKALTPILQWFNELPDSAKQAIVYMLLFAAALGPVMSIGGRVLQLLGWIAGLFGGGGAIAGAFTGLSTFITGSLIPALGGLGAAIAAISAPVLALVFAIGVLIGVIIIFGKDAVQNFINLSKLWVQILVAAFNRIIFEFQKWLNNWIARIRAIPGQLRTLWNNIGQSIVEGIRSGIENSWASFLAYLQAKFNALPQWMKDLIGAHSPAVKFMPIGVSIAQGIGVGFAQGMGAMNTGFGAGLRPAPALAASLNAVRPSAASRNITVGPITINGDLSKSAKERLREEMDVLFTGTIMDSIS